MNSTGDASRRQEIADALRSVNDLIASACSAAGRKPDEVRLVAVTKNFPAADVVHLASLGVGDIGENRDQEASAKVAEVAEVAAAAQAGRMAAAAARAARRAAAAEAAVRTAAAQAAAAGFPVDCRSATAAVGRWVGTTSLPLVLW